MLNIKIKRPIGILPICASCKKIRDAQSESAKTLEFSPPTIPKLIPAKMFENVPVAKARDLDANRSGKYDIGCDHEYEALAQCRQGGLSAKSPSQDHLQKQQLAAASHAHPRCVLPGAGK